MKSLPLHTGLVAILSVFATSVSASDLSYTFMDFEFAQQTVTATGIQNPVPSQEVSIITGDGDGISIGGSMSLRDRFYFGGSFESSIVDVSGVITNPFITEDVTDNFDLIRTQVSFGYYHELSQNLDVIFELSYDATDYDFGSFAGENFDMVDSGGGGGKGLRWNPTPAIELFAFGRTNPVGKPNFDNLVLESDTLTTVGLRWYFFDDLGLGVVYEDGQVETLTITMRFSFGNLPW